MEFEHLKTRYQNHRDMLDHFNKVISSAKKSSSMGNDEAELIKNTLIQMMFAEKLNQLDMKILAFQLLESSSKKEKEMTRFLKDCHEIIQEMNNVSKKYNYNMGVVNAIEDRFFELEKSGDLKYWKWKFRTKLPLMALLKHIGELEKDLLAIIKTCQDPNVLNVTS